MKVRKKVVGITLASALAFGSLGWSTSSSSFVGAKAKGKNEGTAQNVIMMVMDGTSSGATTLARWYKGENLAMDEIVTGGVRTHSAESAITDSAPAGTAMATGYKTNDKFVGVLPSVVNTPGVEPSLADHPYKPVANVLEGAKLLGKSTGIIATSQIQHATPAGFSAHATHRNLFDIIGEQQVYQGIDVVLGGGKKSLLANNRQDKEDLLAVVKDKGYEFVETRDALLNSNSDKIWGAFAQDALAYDMDRSFTKPEEPTIAEMTKKAIDVLSKNKEGFFLFVEGSKPDWAAHANDTIGILSDVLAFDEAVKEALEFAKKDGNTMVVVVSDHGNSGITMGNVYTNSTYPEIPVSSYIEPLKKATMTLEGALSKLKDDKTNIEEVAALYGLDDLTTDEKTLLATSKNVGITLVSLLNKRANIGYSTGGHTGEDVFLYSYGPGKPYGLVDNTELAHAMAKAMGFDLKELDKQLFVKAEELFNKKDVTIRTDITNPENPILVVTKGKKTAQFPVNKNVMIVDGKEIELEGIVVQTDGHFYLPKQAEKLFI